MHFRFLIMINSIKEVIDRNFESEREEVRRKIPPTQALEFLQYEPRVVLAQFAGIFGDRFMKEITIYVVLN